jgi:hypothetical protein
MDMGARFWFGVVGLGIGIALAAYLAFVLIGWAWYAWGLIGALAFIGGVAILFAWVFDRREANRRRGLT